MLLKSYNIYCNKFIELENLKSQLSVLDKFSNTSNHFGESVSTLLPWLPRTLFDLSVVKA